MDLRPPLLSLPSHVMSNDSSLIAIVAGKDCPTLAEKTHGIALWQGWHT